MGYYPIFIELEGKKILVVGGGNVAQRKIETFLEFGASVDIVSRKLTAKLKELVEEGRVRHIGREYDEECLKDASLIIIATNDKQLNHRISKSVREKGMLTNTVDQPSDCNFIVPSIVRKGELLIAISTSGKSPALAKKIRKEIESQFGSEYDSLLYLMGIIRKEVLKRGLPQESNKRIFNEIINSDILDALARNDQARIKDILRDIIPWEISLDECLKKSSLGND